MQILVIIVTAVITKNIKNYRAFPGGPVIKTPCFHFEECQFNPCSRN